MEKEIDKIKSLKKEITQEENRRTKLMWQYAPGFWKFIIVLGVTAFITGGWMLGAYLLRLVG